MIVGALHVYDYCWGVRTVHELLTFEKKDGSSGYGNLKNQVWPGEDGASSSRVTGVVLQVDRIVRD